MDRPHRHGGARAHFRTAAEALHPDLGWAEAEDLGPNSIRLRFNDVVGVPDYYEGIIEAGGAALGIDDTRVVLEDVTPSGAVMRVDWR